MPELKILRQYIQDHNMRNTPEREAIVGEIFSRHDHFSAEDLYQRLRGSSLSISRASVYRAIPVLIGAGLISRVFTKNGQAFYEHIYGHEPHFHLRCTSCGHIEEFMEPLLEDLPARLSKSTSFAVDRYRLEALGRCPKCQKKAAKSRTAKRE